MSPQNTRIAVLPREVSTEVMTSAVSRAAWAVSIAVLLLDIPVVIDMVSRRSGPEHTAVPLLAIAGMLLLLAYTGFRPGVASRVLFLSVGALIAGSYQVSILVVDPALIDSAVYMLNRPAFVLVLIGFGVTRPRQGLAWSFIGFVVSMSTLLISDAIAGVPLLTGWGPVIALGVFCSAYLTIAAIHWRQSNRLPELGRLEAETRRLALEYQFEQRAAAIIHDTVLNDLTVIMNAGATLDDRARQRLRADVATLSDGAWLRESRAQFAVEPSDAALRNGMVMLASELQWRGLSVDVTGNPEVEVLRLSPLKVEALHAAVRACLENVLAHAQTQAVELVLGAQDNSATVMVIDQGVGFDMASVPGDRLGLRASVARRIESFGGTVRVWSTPGSGTTVMISMPCEIIVPTMDGDA